MVAQTTAFETYVKNFPHLERLLHTNKEFKAWTERVNATPRSVLEKEHFIPMLAKNIQRIEEEPAFALHIQYFDRYDLFDKLKYQEVVEARFFKGKRFYPDPLNRIMDPEQLTYFRAYLVKVTKTRYDIFIPKLSRNKTYKTLPAVGAYLKELTAADLVQFASPIPESGTTDWLKTTELEEDILNRCNIRELLFPEEWDPAYVRKRQVIEVMSKEEHNQEEHEDEEPEEKGPHTTDKEP